MQGLDLAAIESHIYLIGFCYNRRSQRALQEVTMALALLDTLKNKIFGAPKKGECGTGSCDSKGKEKAEACHDDHEEEDTATHGGCCGGGCH